MKKITLFFVFVTLFLNTLQTQAQVINEAANWPNTNWTVTGTYTVSAFTNDPTTTSNFSFNDDAAGSGSLFDYISAESPVIDITAATTVVPAEEQLVVTVDYVFFSGGDLLTLEWWDSSTHLWNIWETFMGNSTNGDFVTCSGLQTLTSQPLIIASFSPSQLANFRYRLTFNDNGSTYGFCFGSPTIKSRETPLCFEVSAVSADPTLMTSIQAVLDWTDNNGVIPQNGWEIEYESTGFTQGTGTIITTLASPYTLTGLTPDTCYDVYVRSLCSSAEASAWTGPLNFCTPIPGIECGGVYLDSGGSGGDYSNSENTTTTICPDNAGDVVTVIFTSFSTENSPSGCYDGLTIYNGGDTTAPTINPPNGSSEWCWDRNDTTPSGTGDLEGMTITSTAADGCLTLVFSSDGSVTRPGWEANIFCSQPPTCFLPDNLAVNAASITITEAEVSWIDNPDNGGNPAGGWQIEYGPIGHALGTGTIVNAPTNPFTIIGLTASTEYDFYVRANCGTAPATDYSFWAGPGTFMTKCDVFIAPYTENFENNGDIPLCWYQDPSNSENWLFSNDVTAPGHIGNVGNVNGTSTLSGGYFAWVDDSSPNNLNTGLLSPFVDLAGVAAPTLGFYYISNDEFFLRHVNFSVDIWNGTTWTNDVFTSNSNTAGWEQVFVDLSAFTGQVVQARFVVDENNTGTRDDFAIDDIYIGEMPACVNVNAITIQSVGSNNMMSSWTDGGNIPVATAWEIEYGAPGFTQGTGTIVSANTNPFDLTGLTPQTDYEFYVRSDCGSGEYSLWGGPLQFTTLCPVFDAPYTEDFDDAGVLDACWTQSASTETWQFDDNVTTPGHLGNGGDVSGTTTASGGYFAWVDDSNPNSLNNSITTPLVNVGTLTTPGLSFYYISDNEGTTNVSFSVDVWDGAAWNVNMFASSENTSGWEQVFVNLDGLTITGPVQARFTVNETNAGFRDDLAIDDVVIGEAPTCYPVTDFVAANETTTSVDVSWTDNNTIAPIGGWNVEYVVSTYPQGTGTVQASTTPTAAITGLLPSTFYDIYIQANCASDDSDSSIWAGPFRIKTIDGPPLNDLVANAIELTVTVNCNPVVGNNILATQTSPALATDCADPAVDGVDHPELTHTFVYDDVWYKFTIPASGTVIVKTAFAGGMVDGAISIYTGTFDNLVLAQNYNPDGSVNGRDTCSDDADPDFSAGTNDDDNRFGILQLQNQIPGTEFFVRVWSVDRSNLIPSQGNIHGQFTICVYGQSSGRFSSTLEVEEIVKTDLELTYYPNPVEDVLHLTTNENEKIDAISIYTILGQEVRKEIFKTPSNKTSMDLQNLQSGTYFVKVSVGGKTKSIKMIKK